MATLGTHFHSDEMYCREASSSQGHINIKIFTCDLLSVVQNIISGSASITPLTNNTNAWKIEGEKGKPVVTIQYATSPGVHYLNLNNAERNKEHWDSYMLENRQQNSQINNPSTLSSDSAISDLCKTTNAFHPHNSADETQSVATILHEAITGNALVMPDKNMSASTSNVFDPKTLQKKSTECPGEVGSYNKHVNPDKTVVVSKFVQSTTVKRMHRDGIVGHQNAGQFCTRTENLSRCSILSGCDDGWRTHHVSTSQATACRSTVTSPNAPPCKLCDKSFSCISFRAVHDEQPHTGQKPFRCSYCPKRFTHGSMLITHERSHTVERPFACMYCPKTFTRKNVLEIHKRIHTGEKPYKCSFCSKTFAIKHHKINHERCHTGEKPFSCSYCSKMFSRKSSLKQHESLHTRDNALVPYTGSKGLNGT